MNLTVSLGREGYYMDLLLTTELLHLVACIDKVLSATAGSLLLAGRSGVGRKSAVRIVSALHNIKLYTPNTGNVYGVKNFHNDLKIVCIIIFGINY